MLVYALVGILSLLRVGAEGSCQIHQSLQAYHETLGIRGPIRVGEILGTNAGYALIAFIIVGIQDRSSSMRICASKWGYSELHKVYSTFLEEISTSDLSLRPQTLQYGGYSKQRQWTGACRYEHGIC